MSVNSRRGTLYLLSFSAQFVGDIVAVSVPIFALTLFATPFQIGMIAASRGVIYSIIPFVVGRFLGKADNKRIILRVMLLNAAITSLFYFSQIPMHLVILRFFEGLAMAIFWPTIESLITDTDLLQVSGSLRKFNISWGLGQLTAPIIGGALITFLGMRSPFLVALAATIVNIGLILEYDFQKTRPRCETIRSAEPDVPMRLIFSVTFLGMFGAVLFGFLPAFGTILGLSAIEIGFILFLFGVIRVLFFYKAASVKLNLPLRILLASAGFFLIYLGNRATIYSGVVIVAAASSLLYSYCIEHMLGIERDVVGRRAGMFEGFLGVGSIIGPFSAGLVAEISFPHTFIMVSLLGIFLVSSLKLLDAGNICYQADKRAPNA